MRALIFVLLLLVTPAALGSERCKFYNSSGQNLEWRGSSVVVDPLYMDAFSCTLEPIPNSDAYRASCGGWSDILVIGYASNPDGADALVFQNIFYWRRCEKDHA